MLGVEYGMGIELLQATMAIGLIVVNVMIFVDRRHGMTIATRGARGFAVAAFASALVALMALDHLMIQVWIHPSDDTTFLWFRMAMIGMGLTTAGAVAFWILSRWHP
ncbi:MAG: hypothetical protein GAK28_01673 [Luteibacter sp.]|uniref:hypothetical protein n=1 Tax=Luteibacter sp. TaxID=1886636 RepID=UPI0013805F43|nr:hypothetical protein [Luteibacter sp.]KAF1007342.1 MAG: hypothetical protein GAK28_01981 [Luteibacter sp.]KAF1007716.1 MAG: hypothetical protein GAK28_01673 [Luteibacter sp.]